MRPTPRTWRYLMPSQLLPAALIALAVLYADGKIVVPQAGACQAAAGASVDDTELLLQFVGTQELQRQAQHQIDALFQ